MFLTKHDLTETGLHSFTAEASDLGLPLNRAPREIETDLGNGQKFRLSELVVISDEQAAWVYRQDGGCIRLTIYND